MPGCARVPNVGMVALRKESVDRNVMQLTRNVERSESLSARRAWIEMPGCAWLPNVGMVALRKESVDRNAASSAAFCAACGRSPQGERG